jgi:hypothetical protein
MRVRTAAVISTSVVTLGGLGITVASGATPIWNSAELPAASLTLACPETLALGETGSLSGTLLGDADAPIARRDVSITRDDDFTDQPVDLGSDQTRNDGVFDKVSDTPVNRGNQTYEATFAGNDTYAATSKTCNTDVNGTDTAITAPNPTGVTIGETVEITGQLETAAGEPVADAEIEATDNVDDQPASDLTTTPTDGDGQFTVTADEVAAGSHSINISFGGDRVMEPTTQLVEFDVDSGTGLAVDPIEQANAGDDIAVSGTLTNGVGEPLANATITATDTVDGTTTDLTETTTDGAGDFTVTVSSAAAGSHTVDVSYAGQGPNKPAAGQVVFDAKYVTTLTLTGPDELPADPEHVDFTIKLTDANGPVANARVVLTDGGNWEQGTRTDSNGQAVYTKPDVSDEKPLRIDVTYAEDSTHWGSSIHRIWKAVPRFTLDKDKVRYTAGDLASLTLTAPNGNLPTTIELKPYRRPGVSITPSDTGETAFTRKLYRNSTLTISTEATDRWKAGSRTFTIRVAPRISQTLFGSYDQSGDTYLVRTTRDPRLEAKVLPARPGRCVKAVVQKYIDGSYRTVQTSSCRTLNVESTASFTLTGAPRAGARFRLRFISPADEMNIAGQGSWTLIRFTS